MINILRTWPRLSELDLPRSRVPRRAPKPVPQPTSSLIRAPLRRPQLRPRIASGREPFRYTAEDRERTRREHERNRARTARQAAQQANNSEAARDLQPNEQPAEHLAPQVSAVVPPQRRALVPQQPNPGLDRLVALAPELSTVSHTTSASLKQSRLFT